MVVGAVVRLAHAVVAAAGREVSAAVVGGAARPLATVRHADARTAGEGALELLPKASCVVKTGHKQKDVKTNGW